MKHRPFPGDLLAVFLIKRRLASFVAVFALVQAVAASGLRGCEHSNASSEHAAVPSHSTEPSADGSSGTDCMGTETSPQNQHDDDCLASCVSAMGCTTPGMLAEVRLSASAGSVPQVPDEATLQYRGRFLAPDRPPPRA
jgi:hypothetical protein